MPRKKGDGRGRLGGRAAGTPNRDKPLKTFLRQHSQEYFTPSIDEIDKETGKPTGNILSPFDIDLMKLAADERVEAELKLLRFHTPMMQATSVDLTLTDRNLTFVQRLQRLANGEDINLPDT